MLQKRLKEEVLFFDGGMGTQLQKAGLQLKEIPEVYNIEHSDLVKDIHKRYIQAGATLITTNTFGCNPLKMKDSGYCYCDLLKAGIKNVRDAINESKSDAYVILDIGPIGKMLEPLGDLTFDEAYEIFASMILMAKDDVDAVLFETMSDLHEVKAGILAAKENSSLPIFVTMTFQEDHKTLTGCDPTTFVNVVESLGVDALGVNCSLGPQELKGIVQELLKLTELPIIVQPNAGLPIIENGETHYPLSIHDYKKYMQEFNDMGVDILGGCCGTTPEYIQALSSIHKTKKKRVINKKTRISSQNKTITLDHQVVVCGERLNPTGKKKIKEALLNEEYETYIIEAIRQEEAGAHILDVNVGIANINEAQVLSRVIPLIQEVCNIPLQIDSSNKEALEKACRYYVGKPIINSVNGKDEVLDSILPIVKHYGCAVIGLTLEEGIPLTAHERLEIARKIVNKALSYGIKKEDIIIDCLTLTASTHQKEVQVTLDALKLIKEELNVKTTLGISNISFGLPHRSLLNKTFLTLALNAGLDLAIINPLDQEIMDTIDAYQVLMNIDEHSSSYIQKQSNVQVKEINQDLSLTDMIVYGIKDETKNKTKELLKQYDAFTLINKFIIPALNKVGDDYENKKIYLPQLIQSASSAKLSFDVILETFDKNVSNKKKIMMCTVEGDVHDIGKNIVKVVVESYGYEVIDLGKDVKVDNVLEAYYKYQPDIIGLSALMTSTVVSMKKTIELLKKNNIPSTIVVGGAVLNEDVAKEIGASYYCKDAMSFVHLLEELSHD